MRKAQGGSIAPGVLLEDALEHQDELRRQGFEQMKKRFERCRTAIPFKRRPNSGPRTAGTESAKGRSERLIPISPEHVPVAMGAYVSSRIGCIESQLHDTRQPARCASAPESG